MSNKDIKNAMTEFYNFRYIGNVRDFETSADFIELNKKLKNGFQLMSKETKNFENISKKKINEIIKNNPEHIDEIVLMFRMLTAVSRMNMETYFVSDLCASGIFIPKIKMKDGTPSEREIEFEGETKKMPKYEDLIEYAKTEPKILEEMIKFFEGFDLISKLKNLKGKKEENIVELSKTLLKYSEKGAGAAKSGKAAEKIVKEKLKKWGLKETYDYNKSDEKITEILSSKIDFLKSDGKIGDVEYQTAKDEIVKNKKPRQFDLVFPAGESKQEPKVIVQIVFYTSNTGSEGKKKTNQNIDTASYIKKIIPKFNHEIKSLKLLDGPGWIQMAGDFQKNQYLSENFFQIRTTDTKLKRILNGKGLTYKIDVEMAIMELTKNGKKATKEKILDKMVLKKNSKSTKEEIIKQNSQLFDGKENNDEIVIEDNREETVKKFLILEKLQEINPSNEPEKYKIIIPSDTNNEISDKDLFSEMKKIGFDVSEIQLALEDLKEEGTIIIQGI